MKWFSQTDARWANILLGWNTDPTFDIANYGCVVTAWANLLLATVAGDSATPADVNEWMKDNAGFVPGGGIFRWSTALGMGGVTAKGTMNDLAAVNQFLVAPANFAILQVNAPLPNGSFRQHFVLSPYVDKIVDSEDGLLKNQSTYPFVQAHLYTAINLPVAPVPAPTSGNLNAVVQITVSRLNARTSPHVSAPVAATFVYGTAHTTGWQVGDRVTIGTKTDNVWLRSDAGHWFSQSGANSNFGHAPGKLTTSQHLHLVASETTGGVMKAFNKIRSKK